MDAASAADSNTALELSQLPHALPNVHWYQDHPWKLCRFKNGILMAAALFDSPSSATFIPVSRIISRCAVVDCTIKLDYGEDHVIIAVPLRKPL